MFPINDMIVLVIVVAVLYKLTGRYFDRRAAKKERSAAIRATEELGRAMQAQRRAIAMQPPPPPPAMRPAVNPDRIWDHIPRIAFDLDTQREFGISRYYTVYVTPEEAADFEIKPGVYITDKYQGPRKIGESEQTRWFIPYDQLIKR